MRLQSSSSLRIAKLRGDLYGRTKLQTLRQTCFLRTHHHRMNNEISSGSLQRATSPSSASMEMFDPSLISLEYCFSRSGRYEHLLVDSDGFTSEGSDVVIPVQAVAQVRGLAVWGRCQSVGMRPNTSPAHRPAAAMHFLADWMASHFVNLTYHSSNPPTTVSVVFTNPQPNHPISPWMLSNAQFRPTGL